MGNWNIGTPGGGGGTVLQDYILIRDEKPTGFSGGPATLGSFLNRDLNTIVSDDGGHVLSLIANEFVLSAGTYELEARAPGFAVSRMKIRLQNITAATQLLLGTSQFTSVNSPDQVASTIDGKFTIAAGQSLAIQMQTERTVTSPFSLGVASNFGSFEIFTEVVMRKVA